MSTNSNLSGHWSDWQENTAKQFPAVGYMRYTQVVNVTLNHYDKGTTAPFSGWVDNNDFHAYYAYSPDATEYLKPGDAFHPIGDNAAELQLLFDTEIPTGPEAPAIQNSDNSEYTDLGLDSLGPVPHHLWKFTRRARYNSPSESSVGMFLLSQKTFNSYDPGISEGIGLHHRAYREVTMQVGQAIGVFDGGDRSQDYDQMPAGMANLRAGVDYAQNPVTGDAVQFDGPAVMLGWVDWAAAMPGAYFNTRTIERDSWAEGLDVNFESGSIVPGDPLSSDAVPVGPPLTIRFRLLATPPRVSAPGHPTDTYAYSVDGEPLGWVPLGSGTEIHRHVISGPEGAPFNPQPTNLPTETLDLSANGTRRYLAIAVQPDLMQPIEDVPFAPVYQGDGGAPAAEYGSGRTLGPSYYRWDVHTTRMYQVGAFVLGPTNTSDFANRDLLPHVIYQQPRYRYWIPEIQEIPSEASTVSTAPLRASGRDDRVDFW